MPRRIHGRPGRETLDPRDDYDRRRADVVRRTGATVGATPDEIRTVEESLGRRMTVREARALDVAMTLEAHFGTGRPAALVFREAMARDGRLLANESEERP